MKCTTLDLFMDRIAVGRTVGEVVQGPRRSPSLICSTTSLKQLVSEYRDPSGSPSLIC
jgi:hypothetical protein